MLPHLGHDQGVTFCLAIDLFHYIRAGQQFRMVGQRIFLLIFADPPDPGFVLLLIQSAV